MAYNDKLSGEDQVDTEEKIASMIFDYANDVSYPGPNEEDCAALGRDILRVVLEKFRPDLFNDDNNHAGA
jgi:hypothetical protein